jgi:hypothetical protein
MSVEKRVHVRIKFTSSVLFHRFTGESGSSRQGDVKPRAVAEKHLHTLENGDVHVPGRAVFACLVNAGQFQKLGKKSMTTGKSSLVPAYMTVLESACLLKGSDNKQVTTAKGWEVDTAAVVNPSTGGRVTAHRPRVDEGCYIDFTLVLSEPGTYGEGMARTLVDHAGTKIGLLAFRPQKKGPHGKFTVVRWDVEEISDEAADAA